MVPVTGPAKFTAVVAAPLHKVWSGTLLAVGVGLTVMVNEPGVPGHPLAEGVAVMVAVTGAEPVFVAVNEDILPLPEPAKPMEGVLFTHANVVPGTGPAKFTAVVAAPLHTVSLGILFTVGEGFTVMVNEVGVPGQPLAEGVAVMVAVTGVVPVLVAVKAPMFPLPDVANPMEPSLFVQVYVVPVTVPAKFTAVVLAPLHTVWLPTAFTVGVGFTVMVNVLGVPGHPLALGVTVMVAVTGVLPVLVAVKAPMFPLPDAANPMEGVLFVHVNEVPGTGPAKLTAVVVAPLHTVWLVMAFTVGVGFTVMVNEVGGAVHTLAVGVTVMVAVTGAVPVLVAVKLPMFPLPEPANPMDGVLFVHA